MAILCHHDNTVQPRRGRGPADSSIAQVVEGVPGIRRQTSRLERLEAPSAPCSPARGGL